MMNEERSVSASIGCRQPAQPLVKVIHTGGGAKRDRAMDLDPSPCSLYFRQHFTDVHGLLGAENQPNLAEQSV